MNGAPARTWTGKRTSKGEMRHFSFDKVRARMRRNLAKQIEIAASLSSARGTFCISSGSAGGTRRCDPFSPERRGAVPLWQGWSRVCGLVEFTLLLLLKLALESVDGGGGARWDGNERAVWARRPVSRAWRRAGGEAGARGGLSDQLPSGIGPASGRQLVGQSPAPRPSLRLCRTRPWRAASEPDSTLPFPSPPAPPSTTIDALEREFQKKKQRELEPGPQRPAPALPQRHSSRRSGEKVGRTTSAPAARQEIQKVPRRRSIKRLLFLICFAKVTSPILALTLSKEKCRISLCSFSYIQVRAGAPFMRSHG